MSSGALSYKGGRITANWGVDVTRPPSPYFMEDFIEDTLAEDSTVVLNQSGTPTGAGAIDATAGKPTAGAGGWIKGATDDVDAEIDELALGAKPWLVCGVAGAGVTVCEIGFYIPTALTARQYYFGFTDSETEGTGTNGSLNIQTGTTVVDVATDATGFIFSSLATSPTHWHLANTKNNTQAYIGDSGLVAVAAQYTKLRVELDSSGNAFFYGKVGSSTQTRYTLSLLGTNPVGHKAAAVTSTVALLPIFTAAPTTTTAVPWEVDYLFAAQSANV